MKIIDLVVFGVLVVVVISVLVDVNDILRFVDKVASKIIR